jgi:hypothetical protein
MRGERRFFDVRCGNGNDHAEGMTLFAPNGGPAAPAKHRNIVATV